MTMFLWWRKSSLAAKLLLALLMLAGGWTAWWWADSARCDRQDEFTLRGICLIQIRDSAEQGEVLAQWIYGNYLEGEDRKQEGNGWQLRAMHGARKGVELHDNMIGYCDRVPGFEARTVEAIMQRVAADSPDAHLRLLQLHTYPRCGAFDLDKAAAQIPLLTQCAHLSLAHYLRAARDTGHRVAPATRQAIRSNMALCAHEVAHPPPIADTVREFMPVRQADLDALSRELDALDR
ncbi:hypothetical protein Acav_1128 [Paracidovorax avenae ATCC 19860]|uniref:Uncharacterized protein n=1 Tax=Paracidovorax avenae (strain ATCC 19860 / DSM 7227 / CCUG 15838 / JCM 20985 / LMG 2117 / NCPPB 1011) TaxID=643561 RepID=F0QC63_PARA1|nr:hypothetical protein [Paracidovorax avenae]ADX45050.1 hypothetical protein Acav_1128 [Paracidovorax avenae ATCC 19860]